MSKTKLWTKNFLIITLINYLMFFAFQLFPSALPTYLKSLGAADSVLGWLQGILTIATLFARPFAGINSLSLFLVGAVLAGGLSSVMGYGCMFAFMAIFPALAGILYFVTVQHGKVKA